jgi:membrane-associated phospholipid phosphatase
LKKRGKKDKKKSLSLLWTVLNKECSWQGWGDMERAGLIPILTVVVTLSAAVNIYVGDLAVDLFCAARWLGIGIVVCLFLVMSFLLDLFVSASKLKKFKDRESGSINISALWKEVFTNPLNGLILIIVMTFGITSAQSLSEYYRVNVNTWHDADLWALEASFFYLLKGSLIDVSVFWDRVYFAYWPYLMFVYCVLYRLQGLYDLATLTIATVFCYFLTRGVGLQYPTAGPAFHQPELFDLSGTVSATAQEWLTLYMNGNVPQNGFIPGTMGMPSLHIGVTVMAAWFLARHVRWTLWLSVLWICLLWLSTLMLGWHYALDGVGGIVVALVAVLAARGMLTMMHVRPRSPGHNGG